MPDIIAMLGNAYIQRSIIAMIFIAINAALAGSFTVFKRASFLIAGVSHSALAGAALMILLAMYGFVAEDSILGSPILGALAFAIFMALIAGYATREGKSEELDSAIGIGFALSMSLAVVFITMIREYASRVWGLLFGDLLLLTQDDLMLLMMVTMAVAILTIIFYKEFLFVSFDMEGALAMGIPARIYNYLILSMIAISVVVILKGVGSVLVYAMLISPAATANKLAKSVRGVILGTFLIALTSGMIGLLISFYYDIAPGALASLIATLGYFVVLVIKR